MFGFNLSAGTRTFVHEAIFDKFVAESARLAKERKVGSAFDPTVEQGPQIDEDMLNKVMNYIEAGKKEGAKLEAGGKRIGNVGYFIEPTVFSNVTDNMSICTDEVRKLTIFAKSMLKQELKQFFGHFVLDLWTSSIDFEIQNIGRSYRSCQ